MTHAGPLFRATTAPVADIVASEPDPAASTPCEDWSYGQLLSHLVGGDRLFSAILRGPAADPTSDPGAPGPGTHGPGTHGPGTHGDGLAPAGPDRPAPTVEDYRRASAELADLLEDPEVQARTYEVPAGALDGTQLTLLRSVEHLLHGWDLAKAAGTSTAGLEPVAAALSEPAHQLLAVLGSTMPADRRPFADAVPTGPDAGVLERLVAAFGRDPQWRPEPGDGYSRLLEQFADRGDVELPDGSRRGYGAEGMRVDGRVFACPHQGRLMLKLDESAVTELIAAGLGQPLAKPGQRPMREWVLVPFDGAAPARAERAYAASRASAA